MVEGASLQKLGRRSLTEGSFAGCAASFESRGSLEEKRGYCRAFESRGGSFLEEKKRLLQGTLSPLPLCPILEGEPFFAAYDRRRFLVSCSIYFSSPLHSLVHCEFLISWSKQRKGRGGRFTQIDRPLGASSTSRLLHQSIKTANQLNCNLMST